MAIFQNNLLAGAGAQSSSSVHRINQSIRFNEADTPYMARTFGTPTNAKKWTLSAWVKQHGKTDGASNGSRLLEAGGSSGNEDLISIGSGYSGYSKLYFWSRTSSSYIWRLESEAEYRDPSAWTHVVCVFDSDNTVSSERIKAYINGTRLTTFSNYTAPSSGAASRINTAVAHRIGASVYAGNNAEGYLAETALIDGQALDPSYFGEFKEDVGIWIPKDISGLTFGNNGYYIDGRDASDLGDDESGNGNDFSTSGLGAHDQVLDSPTNNFCTANPLDNYYFAGTFKDGNLDVTTNGTTGNYTFHTSTQKIPTSGKWYVEVRAYEVGAGCGIGISQEPTTGIDVYLGELSTTWSYYNNGNVYNNDSQPIANYGDAYTAGNVIGIAVDMDNNKLYFSREGTFQNSGDPTSGATGTGAISITGGVDYFLAASDDTGGATTSRFMWNFGQDGTFCNGRTAQGNTDANGFGNFYYSVPSGYKALCTRNLGS
tara:strand:- start:6583 stop:8040 length:1458 start_codon:yes stop_codon:yes gene_type:complete